MDVVAFICGLLLPLLTVSKLLLVKNTFSVLSGVYQLYLKQQYFLFAVIGIFSVLFPTLKLIVIGAWLSRPHQKASFTLLKFVHAIGKWSMMDVFVVAVLVVAVKLAGLASVQMREGLYFFTASVILTMLLTHLLMTYAIKNMVSENKTK